MKVLIIIPAYNEAESIVGVVRNLKSAQPDFDYVIINDGSTDHTEQICIDNKLTYISLPVNLGIGGAVQCGYRYAQQNGYDIAIQMDGDGQHDPAYLSKMVERLESGEADLVIGSRFITKEGFQSTSSRRIGISFLSGWAKLLTGIRLRDITSGYRAISKKVIDIYADDYPSDYPEPEAMIIAAMNKFKIEEYPVVMKERENGSSSITLKKSVYYMIKVTLAMLVRRITFAFGGGR